MPLLLCFKTPRQKHFFALAPGPAQCKTNRDGERCHPFRRSRSHLEEADDSGTPATVTELGLEHITLVLKDMCLTHSATAAQDHLLTSQPL